MYVVHQTILSLRGVGLTRYRGERPAEIFNVFDRVMNENISLLVRKT